MAAENINSVGQDYTNNADGFKLGGGATKRNLTLISGDVTITAGGTNELTFPTAAKSDIPSHGQAIAFFTGQAMP